MSRSESIELVPDPEWELEQGLGDPYDGGRAWLGHNLRYTITGHPVHVYALRVIDDPKHGQVAYTRGFQDEVEALQAASGGRLQALPIKGLEGEWIIQAMSYGD